VVDANTFYRRVRAGGDLSAYSVAGERCREPRGLVDFRGDVVGQEKNQEFVGVEQWPGRGVAGASWLKKTAHFRLCREDQGRR